MTYKFSQTVCGVGEIFQYTYIKEDLFRDKTCLSLAPRPARVPSPPYQHMTT